MKYNLFIGRWSPFHEGHKYIIDSFINNGKAVCIGIRETELSKTDPFSAEIRKKIIDKIYKDSPLVRTVIIPDIESVCVGRDVGYSIIEAPQNIKKISGTKARADINFKSPLKTTQKGICLWLTGLPCSGKTTLANALKRFYTSQGLLVQHLDGDEIRKTISKDLGFSRADRNENLLRVAEIAKILVEKNIIVICSFVSPYIKIRKKLKDIIPEYKEIFIKAGADICSIRDVKGMWAKARAGEIKDFTGWNSKYEKPRAPDLTIDTEKRTIEESTLKILGKYNYEELQKC